MRSRWFALPAVIALLGFSPVAAQEAVLPEGVTPQMIKEGGKLFQGQGLCMACHGPEGKGQVGPNLADSLWLHGQGSYAEIVQRILSGVPQNQSKTGVIMPPRGGARINDEQVKAVAAYVWTLSRQRS